MSTFATDPLKLYVVLSRAYEALHAHTKSDIESHGLTQTEFAILEALYHKGPMLLGEVQKKILVSSGGITFLIGFQAFINIGVVTSALPNKGLPLPFISYGGSSLVMMLSCVGVLVSIARHAREAVPVADNPLEPLNPFSTHAA